MTNKLIASTLACLISTAAGLAAQELQTASPAALDKEGTIEISGSGFEANTPVVLLFTTADGVTADIGYALDPAPVADADGNWSTTWSYGRFVSKKLVAAGDFTLSVTSEEFDTLANTRITFQE